MTILSAEHSPNFLTKSYLGPEVPIGITRQRLSYSCNMAPSYIPSALFSRVVLNLKDPVEEWVCKPEVTHDLLLTLKKDDLKNHLENRVQLFLQQLILVYKTKLCFALYAHADVQVGQVKRAGGATYVAAHSGTLPTLRLNEVALSDSSLSFAQNSSFYYGWNTTIYLPEIANLVDSEIDKSLRGVADKVSFRQRATQILNEVSSGTLCPKQGLCAFLVSLVNVINVRKELARSEMKKLILETYLAVAENYYDNLSNGYPLLQKLCLQPIEQKIDRQFYMHVQAQMHQQLVKEMNKLKPPVIEMPQLPAGINVRLLLNFIVTKIGERKLSNTLRENTKLCILSDNVYVAIINYFIVFNQMSKEKREEDLNCILRIKKSATVQGLDLSRAAFLLYHSALKTIRNQRNVMEPLNMHLLVPNLLIIFGSKMISEQAIPLQVRSVEETNLAKGRLRSLIREKIEEANIHPTKASESYLQTCKSAEKVCVATQDFFDYLLYLPDLRQSEEVKDLLRIKTTKTIGRIGLSDKALVFYREVLQVIQELHEKKNPRKISLILCRLLLLT